MISLEWIHHLMEEMKKRGEIPGMLMMNEADFRTLKSSLGNVINIDLIKETNTIFGMKMIIIPEKLYSLYFLEYGKSLLLTKEWSDFLKEAMK